MQHKKNAISDTMMDRSWERMRRLLDSEMPVRHRKRRLWLWLLLLLGVIGASWVLFSTNKSSPVTAALSTEKTADEQPLANAQDPAETDVSPISDSNTIVAPASDHSADQRVLDDGVDSAHSGSSQNNNGIEQPTARPLSLPNNDFAKAQSESEHAVLEEGHAHPDEPSKVETANNDAMHKSMGAPTDGVPVIIALAKIAGLPFGDLRTEGYKPEMDLAYADAPPIIVMPKRDRRWHGGLHVAAYSDNLESYGGWDSGLWLSRDIFSPLRATASISYMTLDKSGFRNTSGTADVLENATLPVADEFDLNAIGYDQALPLVERLSYIGLQAQLDYDVWPFLQLQGGFRYAHLLDGRNEPSIEVLEIEGVSTANSIRVPIDKNALYSSGQLATSDRSVFVGLAIRPLHFLTLEGQYYHGFNAILAENDINTQVLENVGRVDFNRSFRFGLKLQLF